MGVGPLVAGAGLLLLTSLGRRPQLLRGRAPGVTLLLGLGLAITVAPLTATVLAAGTPGPFRNRLGQSTTPSPGWRA